MSVARTLSCAMSRRAVLTLAACCVFSTCATAQGAYPQKQISIIVGFPPGGGVDVIARVMAEKMTQRLGKPVIVENRAGASGSLATRQVAAMPADGYALLMNSNSILANQVINPSAGHDVIRELVPLLKVATQPNILVATPGVGIASLEDLKAVARTRDLDFGSPGAGSIPHLAAEYLFSLTGIKAKHIPFPGAAPALTAVTAGHISLAAVTAPPAVNLVQSGKLVPIVVTSKERMASLPNVPTVIESGIKDFVIDTWAGFFVPAGTPPDVVKRLSDVMLDILRDSDVKEKLITLGFDASGMTSADFTKDITAELQRWQDVTVKANLKL